MPGLVKFSCHHHHHHHHDHHHRVDQMLKCMASKVPPPRQLFVESRILDEMVTAAMDCGEERKLAGPKRGLPSLAEPLLPSLA